ncbi:hypothetical protein SEA_WOLLYPOG_73 [Arthrobacter phage Wollypog]|uniref:Uncharacterized protein n=1 Tax=Arthrobacter phage Wollypog TaxID=2790985 RepID=A0A7T3KCA8_9CAUD|nr:hypothetical protein PP291_gp73 [Arthrobacter phage Wollypog]QPX62622.1 hypothetical protein SEA_WOLLYPOG_73 [Arthrobacter phage Wollypog]
MVEEGTFCWEDSETGCVCGNECEPPKWMQEMWEKEVSRPSLNCGQCAFFTLSVREAVQHVQANETHVVSGEGSEPDTTLEIKIVGIDVIGEGL